MKLYSFKIKGKTSVFKRSDQNGSNTYSYMLITQQALKGLLGAVIGLKGYDNAGFIRNNKKAVVNEELEFNKVFRNLKIGIVPKFNEENFALYYNTRTNATGFGNVSEKQGAGLLLREQWVVDVEYDIYLDVSNIEEQYQKDLKYYLENEEAKFLPYLGRREHFARVYDFKEIASHECSEKTFVCTSTVPVEDVKNARIMNKKDDIISFTEISPVSTDQSFYHIFKEYLYTNQQIELKNDSLEGNYYNTNEGIVCVY